MSKKESNIVKGIAVILLIFHHLFYKADVFSSYQLVINGGSAERKLIVSVAVFAKVCVSVFVFISAYGISKQMVSKNSFTRGKRIVGEALARYIKLVVNLICIYLPFAILSFILHKHTLTEVYGGEGILNAIKYLFIDIVGLAKLFDTPTFNSTWWYISLAVLIIIIVPVLNLLYNRVNWLIIFLIALFVPMISTDNSMAIYFLRYITGISIAVSLARSDSIERFKVWLNRGNRWLKISAFFWLTLICLVLCYFIRSNKFIAFYYIDNILAFVLVLFVVTLSQIRFLKYPLRVIEFLGIYSMNMFLCHTFIKSYYFKSFIYSFKYWWLILIVLLAISLAISFVIEQLKKLCKVNMLISLISNNINADR